MIIDKDKIFDRVEHTLQAQGFTILHKDITRPWGGFFVIDESQAQDFANLYFEGIDIEELKVGGKLSPKILLVAPATRLSWQYHHRRAEIWQVLEGTVGVKKSDNDDEGTIQELQFGKQIKLRQGERHRLIGLSNWGVVAEIWQHTDASNPSDENDIIRIQDDFGR